MAETKHPNGTSEIISFGPYRLLGAQRRLERAGRPVPLGEREFDLLCALIARAGEIVSNRELIACIGGAAAAGTREFRVHIDALRNVLAQDGTEDRYIRKMGRRGYMFAAPIGRATPAEREEIALWDGHIIDVTFPPE